MNCFLWRVDYALEENVLTEQMWLFAAYFILRDCDTPIDFLPLFKCKALHCGWLRVLGCLISPKCLLDLNNSKPFPSCPWMSLFPAMFCHAGPSSLAFLGGRIVIYRSKSQRSVLFLKLKLNINYGEFRSDSVMIALKAMNSKLQLVF